MFRVIPLHMTSSTYTVVVYSTVECSCRLHRTAVRRLWNDLTNTDLRGKPGAPTIQTQNVFAHHLKSEWHTIKQNRRQIIGRKNMNLFKDQLFSIAKKCTYSEEGAKRTTTTTREEKEGRKLVSNCTSILVSSSSGMSITAHYASCAHRRRRKIVRRIQDIFLLHFWCCALALREDVALLACLLSSERSAASSSCDKSGVLFSLSFSTFFHGSSVSSSAVTINASLQSSMSPSRSSDRALSSPSCLVPYVRSCSSGDTL